MQREIRLPTEDEISSEKDSNHQIKLTWVNDTKGIQGCVLFDGKVYWVVHIDKTTGKINNESMTIKEWEDRNKEMTERRKRK